MRSITLKGKTGYKNNNPAIPVIIRDPRGVIFYRTDVIEKPVMQFNLPRGTWLIDQGAIEPLPKPVKYPLLSMPVLKQRHRPNAANFKVLFANNPNKCSVFWDSQKIVFDYALKEKPLYVLYFILYHEYGHTFYADEKLADRWASNYMKIKGFNPSQIGTAPTVSLSPMQYDRKKLLTDNV